MQRELRQSLPSPWETREHAVDELEHRTGGAVGRKILRAARAARIPEQVRQFAKRKRRCVVFAETLQSIDATGAEPVLFGLVWGNVALGCAAWRAPAPRSTMARFREPSARDGQPSEPPGADKSDRRLSTAQARA
jgi:hypothetical protein